jgi:hypothetical protein
VDLEASHHLLVDHYKEVHHLVEVEEVVQTLVLLTV